jgi:hypothetical protein
MVRKFTAVLFGLALIGATAGVAQVSIGAGAQWLSPSSGDYENNLDIQMQSGFGFAGNVMFPVGQSLRVGASGQWSSHKLKEFSTGTEAPGSASLLGIFGEGRYLFGMGAKATPYVAGRVGYAQWSYNESGLDLKSSGLAFGGGVGVLIAMSPTLAIDVNGVYNSHSFGDISDSGTSVSGTSGTVSALQLRAGVNFKLGGGGQ